MLNISQDKQLPEWAKNLKRLRVEHNYTQETFGEKFGVTKMTVSRWEAGEHEPPVSVLAWIIVAYYGDRATAEAIMEKEQVKL
jgi:transcriptional regulator with XRE-family HTH domain